jgi:hypothetical protein
METDDGERLRGPDAPWDLVEDWDLDLEPPANPRAVTGRQASKLIHNLVFSMPAGTPPERLFGAVRDLAREEFALKHRYAMVLHTDQDHPHVHVIVKPMSEQGDRLNIRKATLRRWRQEFARHLRAHGVVANATERAVRGQYGGLRKQDGIYRAMRRGASTHVWQQVQEVAGELRAGGLRSEPGKTTLLATRARVEEGWRVVSGILQSVGEPGLGRTAGAFADRLPSPRTEREWIAERLMSHQRNARREATSSPREDREHQ